MGNTVVVFRLYTLSGLLHFLFFFRSYLQLYLAYQGSKKRNIAAGYISKYLKEQDHSSEEEQEEAETFQFDDFEPFMVLFRRYRPEL